MIRHYCLNSSWRYCYPIFNGVADQVPTGDNSVEANCVSTTLRRHINRLIEKYSIFSIERTIWKTHLPGFFHLLGSVYSSIKIKSLCYKYCSEMIAVGALLFNYITVLRKSQMFDFLHLHNNLHIGCRKYNRQAWLLFPFLVYVYIIT